MAMKYSQEMNLQSESGFCMPFEEKNGNVEMTLGYGEQTHPVTKERFFHHGIDIRTDRYLLKALADGCATGMGTDRKHGMYLIMQYGNYNVKYGHLSSCYVSLGQTLKAGDTVGVSTELLHIETRFNDEEIDPRDLITMIYCNMVQHGKNRQGERTEIAYIDIPVKTDYDPYRKEIEELMLRYYPEYMEDIQNGSYQVGKKVEQSLRNTFTIAALKEYFFEKIPSAGNPLGIGEKSVPIVGKVQNLLLGDFVNYLALKKNIFLSGINNDEKKKY